MAEHFSDRCLGLLHVSSGRVNTSPSLTQQLDGLMGPGSQLTLIVHVHWESFATRALKFWRA